MNEKEAYEYIESVGNYGIVPGLDSIKELCRRLGDPQKDLKFVHVAGTNGKGSVSAFTAAALKAGGYRVGRYISPVIFEYREKIQVNDSYISRRAMCRGLERIKEACGGMEEKHPTLFEIETALAFLYFQEKKCDIVVLETGMGGLMDATNVIENTLVAVITSVSMDHMKFLGNTLEEIAEQKAGIIKKGCHVVSLRQEPDAMEVIERKAAEEGCELTVADPSLAGHIRYGLESQRFDYGDYKGVEISLAGRYQIDNGILALEVLKALAERGFPIREDRLREGFLDAKWPGRFTVIGRKPYFVVDGAHNEDAARRLTESLEFYFAGKRIIYIMGMFRDKEYEKVIGLTHGLADQIITVATPGNPRALSAYELAQAVSRYHPQVTAADSLEEAVEMCYLLAEKEDVIVAFGSLSFLGRLMDIVAAKNSRSCQSQQSRCRQV